MIMSYIHPQGDKAFALLLYFNAELARKGIVDNAFLAVHTASIKRIQWRSFRVVIATDDWLLVLYQVISSKGKLKGSEEAT